VIDLAIRSSVERLALCQHQDQSGNMATSHRKLDTPSSAGATGVRSAASPDSPAIDGPAVDQVAVFSTDLHGSFSACSPAFEQVVGYSSGELAGLDFSKLFGTHEKASPADHADLRELVLKTALGQGQYRAQLWAHAKNGRDIPVQFSA